MNPRDQDSQLAPSKAGLLVGHSRTLNSAASTSGAVLLKTEVYQIVSAAIEVLNGLGHGLLEKPYENALVVEFGLRGINCRQQPRHPVLYKQISVGEYVPDLVVFGKVIGTRR